MPAILFAVEGAPAGAGLPYSGRRGGEWLSTRSCSGSFSASCCVIRFVRPCHFLLMGCLLCFAMRQFIVERVQVFGAIGRIGPTPRLARVGAHVLGLEEWRGLTSSNG